MDPVMMQVDIPLSGLWESATGFVLLMTFIVGGIGVTSRSMAIASLGGYITFVFYAIYVDIQLFTNILYVTLGLVIIAVSFKLWRLEGISGGDA